MPASLIMQKDNTLHKIFYLDPYPTGYQPVFLFHGLGSEGESWGGQMEEIAKMGMRPIAMDIPGFGESTFGGKSWRISTVAEILAQWMNQITPSLPSVVAGISMGGTIALELSIHHPELVKALVLVNTFACLRPKRMGEYYYLIRRFVKAQFAGHRSQARDTAWRIFPKPEQEELRQILLKEIEKSDPVVYRSAMKSLGMFDVRKACRSIHVPTLVITGACDTTVPVENQAELAGLIPGAKQMVIPDGGHAVIADQPGLFNLELIAFLNEIRK